MSEVSVHHARPVRAFAFLLTGLVFFILMDAIAKALATQMGTPLISFVRHAVHAVLMVLIFGPRLGAAIIRTHRPWLQIIRGLMLVGFTLSFFSALGYLPQAEATAKSPCCSIVSRTWAPTFNPSRLAVEALRVMPQQWSSSSFT